MAVDHGEGGGGGRRRIVRTIATRRGGLRFGLETLHGCPYLDQRAVDREVLVRQERCHFAVREERRQDLAGHVGRQ